MLGVIVCYSLSTSLRLSGNILYEKAKQYRLPIFLLPGTKNNPSAFRTAMERFAVNEHLILLDVKSEDQFVIKKSLSKKIDGNVKKVADVSFDKVSYKIECTSYGDDDYTSGIENEYSNCIGTATIDEVRTSIESANNYYGGIKVRMNGGVLFIPENSYNSWLNYERVMEGDGVSFFDVTIENTEGNRKSIWFTYNNYSERLLDMELTRLKKFPKDFKFYSLEDKKNILISAIRAKKISVDKTNNLYYRIEYLKRDAMKYYRLLGIDIPIIGVCKSIRKEIEDTYSDSLAVY